MRRAASWSRCRLSLSSWWRKDRSPEGLPEAGFAARFVLEGLGMRGRLLGLLAMALIAACGGGTTAPTAQLGALKSSVQVTFWHALSGNLQTALTALTDQFNSSQSNVKVTLVAQGNSL